ncbi:MAG: hypothetical protein LBV76_05770 [Deltaproteobacteria bacterium]|jgi:hypothetical protein|nr:hypothetical protein [Deltaproteobacteria bacterium]
MSAGSILNSLRAYASFLLKLYFLLLAGLLFLNCFFRPHDPHFGLDAYVGFWAVFGLGIGLVIIHAAVRLVQPLTLRKEDYYGDL